MTKAGFPRLVKLDVDPTTVRIAADGFRKISDGYLGSLGPFPASGHSNLGELIAAATNLGLAAELYLKALLLISIYKIPKHHHLWRLFNALPHNLQSSIRENYDKNYAEHPNYQLGMTLFVEKSDRPRTETELIQQEPKKVGRDLDRILKTSSEMFETWRYFHEAGQKGRTLFRFEYGPLNLICDAARFHLEHLVSQNEVRRLALAKQQDNAPVTHTKLGDSNTH